MSNVIYILITIGWKPRAYNIWQDCAEQVWISGSAAKAKSDNLILYALVDSSNHIQLQRASKHHSGERMQAGLDWNYTLQLNTYYKKKLNYEKLNALETIQAAASWPNARVHEIHPHISPLCPHCQQIDTPLHSFWTCPRHANSDLEDVTESQHLVNKASDEYNTWPCLWLRGLFPKERVVVKGCEPSEFVCHAISGPSQPEAGLSKWGSGVYFGDASGGVYTSYPTLRRVGVGIACFDEEDGAFQFEVRYPLPGEVQTVPRGETHVLVFLTSMLRENADVTLYTDNKPVHDIYNMGKETAFLQNNRDLWSEIFRQIGDKSIELKVFWIPSHMDSADKKLKLEKPRWMTQWHINGNNKADSLSLDAARVNQVPAELADPIINQITNLRLIQRRLVAIVCNSTHRKKHKQEKLPGKGSPL